MVREKKRSRKQDEASATMRISTRTEEGYDALTARGLISQAAMVMLSQAVVAGKKGQNDEIKEIQKGVGVFIHPCKYGPIRLFHCVCAYV